MDRQKNIGLWVKRTLLAGILLMFLGLFLQQYFIPVKLQKLDGYFIPKIYDGIKLETWLSGNYQHQTEDYVNEEFGFRNFLVRLHNEITFLLFNKTNTKSVVIGKENYLYEYGYIIAYNGKEFLGESAITDSVSQIKRLQDTLNTFGKQLLVVFAPSKVRTYPEYISDSLNPDPDRNTNYKFFKQQFENQGVNFLDFNPIFLNKKETSEYLLFPQLGVHWSRLEAIRAYDTIMKKLSQVANLNLPEIKIKAIREKEELEDPDNDIVNSMNLLFYPPYKKMAYPEYEIVKEHRDMRNLMMIADSYWWDVFLQQIPKKTFDNNEFWYYNKEVWGNSFFGKKHADSLDLKRKILQNDLFILLCTESNYSRIGFGFVKQAINALRKPIQMTTEEKTEYKKAIKENKTWYADIERKASERKISIDSMIMLDAEWAFQHKGPLRKKTTLDDVKASIFINKEWLKEITKKAKEKNISVDSMVTVDAIWYMQSVLKITADESTINVRDLSIVQIKEMIRHNTQWMSEINTKAKKRGISIDSMLTLDANWFKKENSAK